MEDPVPPVVDQVPIMKSSVPRVVSAALARIATSAAVGIAAPARIAMTVALPTTQAIAALARIEICL
jgi:hypothetical protein